MKVSQSFINDFDYLTGIYKWNAEDIVEMKAWIKETPAQNVPYIVNLAAQWRKAEGLA